MKARLEEWAVDTALGVLRSGRHEVRPEPTVVRLLEAFLESPGEVLSRAQLVQRVWEGRHVTPGALTVAVCGLRKALGDDPRQPRFVRTHPGKGYSLLPAPKPWGLPEPEPDPPPRARSWPPWFAWLGAVLALVAFAVSHHH